MKKESVGRERNTDEAIQLVLACIIFPIHIDFKKILTNSSCFANGILIEIIEEFCSHLQKFRLENLKKESVGRERNIDEAIQLVFVQIPIPAY